MPGHFRARVGRRPHQTPYKKDPKLVDLFQPKSANVTEITDTLAAVCQLSDEIDPPIWLADGDRMPPPGALFAGANGLLDLTMVAPASRTQPDILRSQAMAVAMRPKAARQHAAGATGRSRSSVRPRWRPRSPTRSHAPTKARWGWLQHLVCNIEQTERGNPVNGLFGEVSLDGGARGQVLTSPQSGEFP